MSTPLLVPVHLGVRCLDNRRGDGSGPAAARGRVHGLVARLATTGFNLTSGLSGEALAAEAVLTTSVTRAAGAVLTTGVVLVVGTACPRAACVTRTARLGLTTRLGWTTRGTGATRRGVRDRTAQLARSAAWDRRAGLARCAVRGRSAGSVGEALRRGPHLTIGLAGTAAEPWHGRADLAGATGQPLTHVTRSATVLAHVAGTPTGLTPVAGDPSARFTGLALIARRPPCATGKPTTRLARLTGRSARLGTRADVTGLIPSGR